MSLLHRYRFLIVILFIALLSLIYYQTQLNISDEERVLKEARYQYRDYYRYYRDQIYFYDPVFKKRIAIENADPKSFQPLNDLYSRDRDSIYYRQHQMDKANLESFIIRGKTGYTTDNQTIFFRGEPVELSDGQSFQFISDDPELAFYAKDKNNVYRAGKIIANADPNTFKVINPFWAKDHLALYYREMRLDGVDPSSAKVVASNYVKDRDDLYRVDPKSMTPVAPLGIREPDSFHFLNEVISADANNLYWLNGINTFHLLPNGADGFHYFGKQYFRNDDQIYYIDIKKSKVITLNRADPNSFRLESIQPDDSDREGLIFKPLILYFRDNHHCYDKGNMIDCQHAIKKRPTDHDN